MASIRNALAFIGKYAADKAGAKHTALYEKCYQMGPHRRDAFLKRLADAAAQIGNCTAVYAPEDLGSVTVAGMTCASVEGAVAVDAGYDSDTGEMLLMVLRMDRH